MNDNQELSFKILISFLILKYVDDIDLTEKQKEYILNNLVDYVINS